MRQHASILIQIIAALAALVASSQLAPAQDNTITLRPVARLQQAGPVTLGEVADLAGPEALRLKALVVVEDFAKAAGTTQELRLELSKVRTLIEAQPGVNMGRLLISGSNSIVKLGGLEPPAATRASGPASPTSPTSAATRSAGAAPTTALGARVAERIALTLDVPESDVRVSFPASDQPLLATPLSGRTLVLQPGGQGARMPINVRVFEGDRIVATGTVRPTVEVRRNVLIASMPIAKGDAITGATAAQESRWLSTALTPADPLKSMSNIAKFAIAQGEIIEARSVESPIVVERGDLVAVDCLSGSFVVRAQARAKAPGRVGDVVEFLVPGSKRPFQARIDGPGRAVMVSENAPPAADATISQPATFPLRTLNRNTPAEPAHEHNPGASATRTPPAGAR